MRAGLAMLVLAACGGDDAVPLFPADYAATYAEVRDCRGSADHDLNQIRVRADATGRGPYLARDVDFPVGAVILKEEFDFADTTCAGPVVQWTVMRREDGGDPARLGWTWQRVDRDRTVVTEDEPRCFGCHAACGIAPDGYRGTCAVP